MINAAKYVEYCKRNGITKDDMKKVKYSKTKTANNVSQKSFIGKFLSSVKQKMYGKRQF